MDPALLRLQVTTDFLSLSELAATGDEAAQDKLAALAAVMRREG